MFVSMQRRCRLRPGRQEEEFSLCLVSGGDLWDDDEAHLRERPGVGLCSGLSKPREACASMRGGACLCAAFPLQSSRDSRVASLSRLFLNYLHCSADG